MNKKVMNEQQFNKFIYKLVKESLDTFKIYSPFEAKKSKEDSEKSKEDSEKSNDGETEKQKKVRLSVEKQLQRPGIDIAPYAYELEDLPITPENGDDNEHKNARSKLYKKINHKPDSNGDPQYLSPEEVIQLKSELSSNLSESRKLRLSESDIMYMVNESVKTILRKKRLNESMESTDEMAKQVLLQNITNPNMKKHFCYYNGECYGGFELETEDGWYFYCEEFGCDVKLDSWSSYSPQTYWEPESSDGPEGHIEGVDMEGSVIEYLTPGHDPRTEECRKLIPDEEIKTAFDEQFEATEDELGEVLNEIEMEERSYYDY